MNRNSPRGFGFLELLITMAVFSIVLASIVTLNLNTHRQTGSTTEVARIRAMRQMLIGLVLDGPSWLRTTIANGAPVGGTGYPTVDTAMNSYATPPQAAPPYSSTTGAPFHILDGAGTMIVNVTAGQGFTRLGTPCSGFNPFASSPQCPLRWEPRWFVATNASNPIVYISLNLLVSPGTMVLNGTEHSATFENGTALTRQLFLAWSNLGPTTSARFARFTFWNVPNCNSLPCPFVPSFTHHGAFCGSASGSLVTCSNSCAGNNGTVQVYRCQ